MPFRDLSTDLLTSDGEGPYIDGGAGIDYAAVDFGDGLENSLVKLGFIQPRRKNKGQETERHLWVDLSGEPSYEWSEEAVSDLHLGGNPPGVYAHNAFFFIEVPGRMPNDTTPVDDARFVIHSERTSSLAEWRISYSSRKLTDLTLVPIPFPDTVTVSCKWFVGDCIAWQVDKDLSGPFAALTGGGTSDLPDAGVWELPFALGLCRLDAYQGPLDEGDWCKGLVGF